MTDARPERSAAPVPDPGQKARLAELVGRLAVVHGRVTLSSGREADYYVDLRRITLQHEASPLIGVLLRQLTADWAFDAVGGLTLGADPVATAVMHAAGRPLDTDSQAFTLELALQMLESAPTARTTVQSPLRWSASADWKLDYCNVQRLSPEELQRRRAAFDAGAGSALQR